MTPMSFLSCPALPNQPSIWNNSLSLSLSLSREKGKMRQMPALNPLMTPQSLCHRSRKEVLYFNVTKGSSPLSYAIFGSFFWQDCDQLWTTTLAPGKIPTLCHWNMWALNVVEAIVLTVQTKCCKFVGPRMLKDKTITFFENSITKIEE